MTATDTAKHIFLHEYFHAVIQSKSPTPFKSLVGEDAPEVRARNLRKRLVDEFKLDMDKVDKEFGI